MKKSNHLVLFVDDEEKTRKYFKKALESEFNIITAQNVSEAKIKIKERSNEIAVVITDQRMPGGNGVILLEYLRNDYPDIIRLLTTAYSDIKDAINSVNAGEIFRYIQKPWDYQLLKTELHQAIDIFETKSDRNQLLNEKITVKKRLSKTNRVKSLILLSRTIKLIRFTDFSINNFINQFANASQPIKQDDLNLLELGKDDLLETLFLINIIDKIYDIIDKRNNYDFLETLNKNTLINLLKEISSNINVPLLIEVPDEINEISINNYTFNQSLTILLNQLHKISKETIKININQNSKIDELSIKINISKENWPENENIFISSSQKEPELYTNLLICYLLIGHHGGIIETKYNNNEVCLEIILPNKPQQINKEMVFSKKENLDNTILSSMLA